ncbi:glycosyltransferase family 2 protein [Myriangium duriaei CBS 260.36]|uniref:Glycosyltransferase family 2 protein n=1 Tax=Myriangium duriaei CBS 260.36 TaxID=1168546 RepID=A0A9P4MFW1_9PEZI|nr:glycosyltransferase family 2 protein [Myriangium duriaei CBS 260.36]
MALSYSGFVAILLFFFRYLRLVVNLISHWTYRSIPIADSPSYTSKDVTVIVPTIEGDGDSLRRTIRACLVTDPAEVIVVTIDANVKQALHMAAQINFNRIRVLSVAKANKRRQMCRAIPYVKTKITIFADDDVIWPATVIPWMLAPFEDDTMGAVGTSQRLVRPKSPSVWTFLGSLYLERRNFDCSACLNMDGGLPCLSGRTVAYRTCILQEEDFGFHFTNETWRTHQLNADDDNFMTRWMFRHGWKIAMQYNKACEVQTTLEDGPTYLKQCLRWVRSNWRSNLTSLFVERHYWSSQPWTTYAVFQTTLTAWAMVDPILFSLIWRATNDWPSEDRTRVLMAAGFWIFGFAKTVKLLGHFVRYPADLTMLPISVLFGYVHGVIKLIGLFTLFETAWGSREGADEDDRLRMIRLPPYMRMISQGEDPASVKEQDATDEYSQNLPPYQAQDDSRGVSTSYHD